MAEYTIKIDVVLFNKGEIQKRTSFYSEIDGPCVPRDGESVILSGERHVVIDVIHAMSFREMHTEVELESVFVDTSKEYEKKLDFMEHHAGMAPVSLGKESDS